VSAYDNDPRVAVVGDQWEIDGLDSDSGSPVCGAVIPSDGGGFKAWFGGAAGSPQLVWPTADAAIRSMIGAPQ
jgi:hypothetical protein